MHEDQRAIGSVMPLPASLRCIVDDGVIDHHIARIKLVDFIVWLLPRENRGPDAVRVRRTRATF